eukprot:jgi/Botrbrau1/9716/Bobra.0388s0009.1
MSRPKIYQIKTSQNGEDNMSSAKPSLRSWRISHVWPIYCHSPVSRHMSLYQENQSSDS